MNVLGKVSWGVWEENKRFEDPGRRRPGDAASETAERHCESSGVQRLEGESQWDGESSAEYYDAR